MGVTLIHERVEAARAGTNPTVVCQVSTGWVVMGDVQFLRGYSLLLPDPVVCELNALSGPKRCDYLYEMSVIGDALLEVTEAYRINYEILGNADQALHAHVTPRYTSEPEQFRNRPAWSYARELREAVRFDPERDHPLMRQLASAIRQRL